MTKEEIKEAFMTLQDTICEALEETDGKGHFQQDNWERSEGGGGRTRILNDGKIIEKGGVNFSAVHGPTPEKILSALGLKEADFFATGVSIVMHPKNPNVPIIHMNVRYFEMTDGTWWFGGGIDLTPHYIDKEQAKWFHKQLKSVCDKHDANYYPKFKKWADDYFYLKHRKETRGVGGIFFDRLSGDGNDKTKHFNFVLEIGQSFAPIYTYMMKLNAEKSYSELQQRWQRLRRGRYVEFNLVWDKGTKFGLDTDGRTESILMSLPPQADWSYNVIPEPNSAEAQTQELLKKDIDWLNIC